ncbi:MAG TPA: alpha/beta hydrolase [Deltaproteobacteria bacterium]|nr:alpha/beta hydrolase [Deltaproteobacteria bacterium]
MKVVISTLVIYIVYCILIFVMQRVMLFPRGMIGLPSGAPPKIKGMEILWLNTKYGKVESWYLPPVRKTDDPPAPVVIFAHGNGELIDFWPQELNRFNEMGIGLLLVEYPGYGRSEGKPSEASISETFLAAYDLISKRSDIDSERVILLGRSLGGGAVCIIAANRPSAAMILMSSFTSVTAFAPRYLAPKFLVRDPFDNLSVVKSYPNPILIIHGNRDEVIPYSHGRTLYKAAKSAKMITYQSGHNDCPPDWNVFWEDVESFLRDNNILNAKRCTLGSELRTQNPER